MEKKQPVHEGYLRWLPPAAGALQVQFCQLSWSCQLRLFPSESAAETGVGATTFSVRGFCQWEGLGVLPLDSYGLELQLKDKKSLYVAAENRLDLERWCRAFIAVLDPNSEAAEEIKRERRKVKREIRKKLEKELEAKEREEARKRQWIAQKKQELLDREREIEEMTPLQRKDGLGTLDEETEKLLRERKKRLNKKAAQGRVGKETQRRRLEMMAGGKLLDAAPPIMPDSAPRKAKLKFELPPPGQCTEPREPKPPRATTTESVSSQDSVFNDDDASVSGRSEESVAKPRPFVPPPPPPPMAAPINPMAAALDAIKRNRKYSVDSDAGRPSRSRRSQLSAEGKELLTRALSNDKLKPERRGLFDSSDSDDDAPTATKPTPVHKTTPTHVVSDSGILSPSGCHSQVNADSDAEVLANAAPARVAAVLSVSYVACAVESRGGKPVAVYTFDFKLHTWVHRVGFAYHEFEATHQVLKAAAPALPKFPSKHVLRNPTKPDFMAKRAGELSAYLQGLLAVAGLVQHPSFHTAFRLPAEWAASLVAGLVATARPPPVAKPPTRKVSARNLFEEDSSDDDEASVVSAEAPEPVFAPAAKPVRPPSQRFMADELPARRQVAPPVAVETMVRQPSRRDIPPPAAPPAIPVRPNPFGGAGRGDLLAAIRKGTALKSVEPDAPTPSPVRAAPLPVTARPPPVAPRPPLATAPSIHDSIATAMASRLHVTKYDDPDDDDDSDWDD
ncbi:hypothetical protein ACHHYP_02082 [Achlya hypogyna]|uniref:PX domain-containing protein n=1 Tax=Achlya hypogyna TaxID=1202772 RepID=A0A1V9ZSI7_ACHHY|nr:hypothetical protein ACHHYP_02082 [Achlya hypogyna]